MDNSEEQNINGGIELISKAIRVIMSLSVGNSRLSDIAREVNISKNGVFRLLQSLKKEGVVIQDPITRGYFMGPRLFEITFNPQKNHQHLVNIAFLGMEDLNRITGETISLDIKFGMEKITLRRLIGTHEVTYVGKPNPLSHLWLGSSGKALLSQLSEDEFDSLLKHITLVRITPFSITKKEFLKNEIAKVKEIGYATSFSETDMGVASVAIPITGYIVPAALSIAGPEDRVRSHLENFISLVMSKGRTISQQLTEGY